MSIPTEEAMKAELDRRQKIYDDRKKDIIFFIEKHPGLSQYSLSKQLEIPRTTLGRMLDELVKEKQIKIVETSDGDRIKYEYYIMKLTDFTWDFFTIDNFADKYGMRLKNRALALSTLNRDIPVTIELDDGSERILRSEHDLDELLSTYH